VEKLIGWSVLMDVAPGARHPCATATHNFATSARPLLLRFSNGVTPIKVVMEHVLGTLFQTQQEFFLWLAQAKTATTAAGRPVLPDHARILKELSMGSYQIAKAPETWARLVTSPKEAKPAASLPKTKDGGNNLQPNLVMQKRCKDSGSPALGAMMEDLANNSPRMAK
jgi:hypothetical protein